MIKTEKLTLGFSSTYLFQNISFYRQMLRHPGLLIMDEPDAFLDFEHLNGLRDLINDYKETLLVITRSRYLLSHCFDRIRQLENGNLLEYEDSFTEYSHALLQKKVTIKLAVLDDEEEIHRITSLAKRPQKNVTHAKRRHPMGCRPFHHLWILFPIHFSLWKRFFRPTTRT